MVECKIEKTDFQGNLHSATVLNDNIYSFGGVQPNDDPESPINVDIFNPETFQWRHLRIAEDSGRLKGRYMHKLGQYQNAAYLFGGSRPPDGDSTLDFAMYRFDPKSEKWSVVETACEGFKQMPLLRGNAVCTKDEHTAVVWGGYKDILDSAPAYFLFDFRNSKWHSVTTKQGKISDTPNPYNTGDTTTLIDGKIYTYGSDEMHALDLKDSTWRKLETNHRDTPLPPHCDGRTAWNWDGKLHMFGPGYGLVYTQLFQYDPRPGWNNWTLIDPEALVLEHRHGHCSVKMRNRIFSFGGVNRQDKYHDDMIILNMEMLKTPYVW